MPGVLVTDMLAELQQQLNDIYQVAGTYDVRDYIITDPTLAKILGQDALLTNTDETLFVSQDEDGLALSLFFDADMLDRLESCGPLDHLRAWRSAESGPNGIACENSLPP